MEEAVLDQITRLHTPTVELYKAVRDAVDKLQSIDEVPKLRSPLDPRNPDLMAWDLRSALITFRVRGKPDQAAKRMEPILTTVRKVQGRHPRVYVAEFGKATSDHELEKSIGKDFKRAEISTVPLTIAILLMPSARSSPPACPSCSRSPGCSRRQVTRHRMVEVDRRGRGARSSCS